MHPTDPGPTAAGRRLRPIRLGQWKGAAKTLSTGVETTVTCAMPTLLDDADYRLFIGARAKQPHYSLPLEQSSLSFVTDARVLGDKLVVVSADDHVFFETYWSPTNLNDGRMLRLIQANPPLAELREIHPTQRIERAILLGNPMSENYHHWIINCLPRLRMTELYPELADWPLIVQQPLNSFQRDSLAAIGISEDRLVKFDGGICEVRQLAIPSNGVFAPSELRWVRDRIRSGLGIRPGKPRRIYVSRADASLRRISNEPEVIECLRRHGFETIQCSGMSFRHQVQAIADAQIIAGPHGAGLTNMIFGDERLKALEFHPADEVNYCFWLTAGAMGQRYGFLSGTPTNPQRDFMVDLGRLEGMLKKFSE